MSEKGRQVSLMGKIYSHAKAVTVWLGPEEDDSAAAFALIRDLGRHERNITGTFSGPIKWGERDLQAVYLLFARPWFERLRVRQEIYSAKNAMVQCGPDKMAWFTFKAAAKHIRMRPLRSDIYGDVLRASGILITVVDEIYPLTLDVNALSRDTVIDHVRAIKPDVHIARTSTSGLDILEAYASALADSTSFAADDVVGYRIESLMDLDQAVAALHTIWSWDVVPEIDWETLSDLTVELMEGGIDKNLLRFLDSCIEGFIGRCFMKTGRDYIGRATVATRPGGVLCVILGADYPLILRRTQQLPVTPTVFTATQQSTSAKWQIVGPCKVPGLMADEAIHGSLPRHYQPARRENYSMDTGWDIDVGLLDHRDGSFRRNPADILNEMGIRHLRYQQEPHQLEVEPKTLREAGVDLQDFYIV